HLGRHVGVGGKFLERIARCEREDREKDDADPDEARNRDEQLPQDIPAHESGFHASRYQSFSSQRSLSHPESCGRSLFDTAATRGRYTSGMTARDSTAISFGRMNIAARFTGSSSPSAAR